MSKRWWFIAINGTSCAANSFPSSGRIDVIPRPETLVGFVSRRRQLEVQSLLLTCPADKLPDVWQGIKVDCACGDATIKRFDNPEPPTDGPTMWAELPGA